jgi:hypothetical protein
VSNTCFELLLASFIQLECSPTASTAAAAESWANERVLEKIGGDCAAASAFSPLSEAKFLGFDVGVRMAERCSRDFPKRMGTELQVTTHKFGLQSQPQAQRSPPPFPPSIASDRFMDLRPFLEGSVRQVDTEASHQQPQPVRDRGPKLPHAVRRSQLA